ncbi:MAG TPA: AMP-binding protein [Actinomycetota bacterium]|nr:AMP-binding protein [Actinomycetota bacterium]
MSAEPKTVADLITARAREHPDTPFILFGSDRITYGDYLERCTRVARAMRAMLPEGKPPHVGVLMGNSPEFLYLIGGAAIAVVVIVGINATRRGHEIERDINHTDCAFIVADGLYRQFLSDLAIPPVFGFNELRGDAEIGPGPQPDDLFLLIFTSGTSGAPKAVRCSHKRMIGTGTMIAETVGLVPEDVAYVALPLFHSNPLMCGYLPTLIRGSTMALASRFSVRRFLPDVRMYGATYFPYTGKPLSHLLTAPEKPNDADNPLRIAYGNEGSWRVIERFERRFGCRVIDGFGPSEGAMGFPRVPTDPPGSVGRPPKNIKVLEGNGRECPVAKFDQDGKILNAEECVGEIVNVDGVGRFEGYYNNPEAEARRVRDGMYWSGDLGYMDERGFLYFAGRTEDWIRVDGENFPPHPIEDLVERHPAVFACAAYAVPDESASDRVMIAVQTQPGRSIEPPDLFAFLSSQPDLSPKWLPTYVLIASELPRGVTGKVLVRELRREKFFSTRGEIYWRERGESGFKPFTPGDEKRLRAAFEASGRARLLDL